VPSLKTVLRQPWALAALSFVLANYLRLVHVTSRWQMLGHENFTRYWDRREPFIPAFWHGRLAMMPYTWRRGVPICMLQSPHPDGRLIALTVNRLGIQTIYGSSKRGGAAAMRAVIKTLQAGTCVGFTPEGPRGPRMRAGLGVVHAARLSGRPIVPCTFAVRRRRVFKSWDRFVLALPFTRGVFICGEPIHVDRNANDDAMECARQLLEDRLNAITEDADKRVGVPPIAPAPAAPRESASRAAQDENGAPRAMAGRP
jgi:lysophospholipid acyltransferase (LPLAT)-like uncharacterized protein